MYLYRTVISFERFCLVQVFIVSLVFYFVVLGKDELSVYSLITNVQHVKIISDPDHNYPFRIFSENGFFVLRFLKNMRPRVAHLNCFITSSWKRWNDESAIIAFYTCTVVYDSSIWWVWNHRTVEPHLTATSVIWPRHFVIMATFFRPGYTVIHFHIKKKPRKCRHPLIRPTATF